MKRMRRFLKADRLIETAEMYTVGRILTLSVDEIDKNLGDGDNVV